MEVNVEQIVRDLVGLIVPYGLNALGAIAILVLGRFAAGIVSKLVRRAMNRAEVDPTITGFVGRIVSILVLAFAVVAALAKFGIQTTSFVAILGAAGFAVGLALQGSLSNFAAGVLIVIFRPYSIGHFIDAAGVAGTVKEIRLFTTELATPDNVMVVVPNSAIFGGTIKNFSVYDTRRIDITVGIGYGSSIERAIEVLMEMTKNDERVNQLPEPQIVVSELADSSVNLLLRCWTSRADFWPTKCDLTRRIKEELDLHGIEIPFPQRVVHMANASQET